MVSHIDVEIERAVRGYLHERHGEIGFKGEEEGSIAPDGNGLYWVLDPIDGAANFVKGIHLDVRTGASAFRQRSVSGRLLAGELGYLKDLVRPNCGTLRRRSG